MIIFSCERLLFLFASKEHLSKINLHEILYACKKGLYIDTSMACYFLIIPIYLLFIQLFWYKETMSKILKASTYFLVFLTTNIASTEVPLYKEWNTKLNSKVFIYLKDPTEIFNITPHSSMLFIIVSSSIIMWFSYFLYSTLFQFKNQISSSNKRANTQIILSFLFINGITILGARGGIQEMPIQQSDVYFSKNNYANLLAINSTWNLTHSLLNNKQSLNKNPYKFQNIENQKNILKTLYNTKKDTTVKFLKSERPNIILLILESFSADLIQSLGGISERGITPNFEKLISEGLLFDQIYASAERSDQGMASIFGGFPAQQHTSISTQPNKASSLPSLVKELAKQNYWSSFHFGGQLNFGNIKAYMYSQGVDKIIDEENFPSGEKTSRLGVHDDYLFKRVLSDQKKHPEPFLSITFTQSTHSPYDQPVQNKIAWSQDMKGYLNGAWFTDSCLYDYICKAKNMKWFENSIFVMIADHSHTSPRYWDGNQPEARHIPLLFWGPQLKSEFRGKRIRKIANQNDFTTTLLKQLKIDSKLFPFSKNIMNPYSKEFAYYCSENAIGWIDRDKQNIVFNTETQKRTIDTFLKAQDSKEAENKAKVYVKSVFDEYLKY